MMLTSGHYIGHPNVKPSFASKLTEINAHHTAAITEISQRLLAPRQQLDDLKSKRGKKRS
jgi:hypothetical protein